jgi:hypothetical protein
MLKCIAHDPECLKLLATLVADIQNGNIPSEVKPYILASTLIPLPKPDTNIRPIACGEIIYRVTASRAVKLLSKQIADILLPYQYGVGVPGGCEIILHDLQHTLEQQSLKVAAFTIDFKNAFNTVSRIACIEQLHKYKTLQPLFRLVNFAYSQPSPLLSERSDGTIVHELSSKEGTRQGDRLAPSSSPSPWILSSGHPSASTRT